MLVIVLHTIRLRELKKTPSPNVHTPISTGNSRDTESMPKINSMVLSYVLEELNMQLLCVFTKLTPESSRRASPPSLPPPPPPPPLEQKPHNNSKKRHLGISAASCWTQHDAYSLDFRVAAFFSFLTILSALRADVRNYLFSIGKDTAASLFFICNCYETSSGVNNDAKNQY